MKIRIATRQSPLALIQTHHVRDLLLKTDPTLDVELVPMTTVGDKIQHCTLAEIGGKGLFIKNLEEALLENRADIAVHSLKDVPPNLDDTFSLAAILKRASPFDALVSPRYESLESLPQHAIIGTCSVRRKAALLHIRPDLNIKMIRGNVDTRIKKLEAGEYDALILAEAGLSRLGLSHYIRMTLSPEVCVPSVGQGAIAIECLKNRHDLMHLLSPLNDPDTFSCITAERSMNFALNASCSSPIGSFAILHDNQLHLSGVVWSEDGKHKIETLQSGNPQDAHMIGECAASHLKEQGAERYL